MKQRYFITGTDTDVGKTYVTTKLLEQYGRQGLSTIGIKPIASGCETTHEGLRNDDAIRLMSSANIDLDYQVINPFAFAPPVSPNIAASNRLSLEEVTQKLNWIKQNEADIILVEGSGGWLCPINHDQTMADMVKSLDLEVILVVGLKLGCINHSLLSYQAIINHGLKFKGWIANQVDPGMLSEQENIQTITSHLGQSYLEYYPYED